MSVAQDKNPEDAAARHFIRFEPPDLILSRPEGELPPEEARVAWDIVRKETSALEAFYWIVDISRLRRYSRETMRTMPEDMVQKIRAYAVVGGSFQQRIILSVGIRAGRLLFPWARSLRFEFFPDEPSARAWIDGDRAAPRA